MIQILSRNNISEMMYDHLFLGILWHTILDSNSLYSYYYIYKEIFIYIEIDNELEAQVKNENS